jgi:DNA-binding transcriptional regulator YdaS (Cro superfamily)
MKELPASAAAATRSAIQALGGPSKAARRLNVPGGRAQTIQAWLRTRVPAEWCPLIEQASREVGAPHLCEDMRPDVAWHVLRGNPLR